MTALMRSIDGEAELMLRFAALLRQEQAALQSGNADALPELTTQKIRLIDTLNITSQRRNQQLADLGLAPDQPGMTAWLAANPGENAVAARWQALLDLAREIRALSQINGELIALHLRTTQEAIAALTEGARQAAALYGRDGQATPLTGHRIIDSA